MVNITHIITSFSAWWNPEVLELRQFALKRADLIVATYESQELPPMHAQCEAKLTKAEVSLAEAKEEMEKILGTGALAILQKEIDDGKALVEATKSRCAQYADQFFEVLETQSKLAKEVDSMQKKPKGQKMAEELDRVAEEAGRL